MHCESVTSMSCCLESKMLWVRLRWRKGWRKGLWLSVSQGTLYSCLMGEIVCFSWVSIQSVNEFVTQCKSFGASFARGVLFSVGEEEEGPRG